MPVGNNIDTDSTIDWLIDTWLLNDFLFNYID
jgi:hypothetical protein